MLVFSAVVYSTHLFCTPLHSNIIYREQIESAKAEKERASLQSTTAGAKSAAQETESIPIDEAAQAEQLALARASRGIRPEGTLSHCAFAAVPALITLLCTLGCHCAQCVFSVLSRLSLLSLCSHSVLNVLTLR